ncbi:hypothetical protein ACKAV7_014355 [Fusarium commune]
MPSKDPELFYESSPDTRMPGVQCPKCTTAEEEVWVIPGHSCPYCGMVLNVSKNSTVSTFNMGREMTGIRGRCSVSAFGKYKNNGILEEYLELLLLDDGFNLEGTSP